MLKAAVIILTILLVYAGIYTLIIIIAPKVMLQSTFEAITGQSLDSVQDASYLKVLVNRYRTLGLYVLVSVIFSFFVLFAGFRKAQKWAWWCFLFGGGIAWVFGLVNNIILGSSIHILLQAIGTALLIVGVLLPVKAFFAKKAT